MRAFRYSRLLNGCIGDWEKYTKAMVHLCNQNVAISELARICARARAVLLCYEADPNQCHRTYVARVVSSVLDGHVKHIRAEGVIRDRAAAVAA